VFVRAASGWVLVRIDQVNTDSGFHSLGVFTLRAGRQQPVAAMSTEGLSASPQLFVSLDALKLVKTLE
jgi:hypothetical protein